jgi:hypothetical protein
MLGDVHRTGAGTANHKPVPQRDGDDLRQSDPFPEVDADGHGDPLADADAHAYADPFPEVDAHAYANR